MLETTRGLQVARLTGGVQTFACGGHPRAEGVWLAHIVDGQAKLQSPDTEAVSGDTCYGSTATRTTMTFAGPFNVVFVHLPKLPFGARLARALSVSGGVLRGGVGMGDVLGAMAASMGRVISSLTPDQLRPIEMTLSELVATALAADLPAQAAQARTYYQDAIFQRLCQAAELRLGDPDLTIEMIADEQGVSPRMAAKAFAAAGRSFKTYLRNRRLDRCSDDLRNPADATLGISAIGARWGFLDAAGFSRAFQERFGVSPRVWRSAAPSAREAQREHRGAPGPLPPSAGTRALSRFDRPVASRTAPAPLMCDTAPPREPQRHYLPATSRTVHWGYFSRFLAPVLTVAPGDIVTIETLTHHATDDHARMIAGDPGAEDVFGWTATKKNIDRRGAGPMDASILGRGAGEGFGVHVCTGPVAVQGAAPGDVLEIRVLDITPRLSRGDAFQGRSFGSNAATWWGYHYRELLTEPKPREVITIYEMARCQGGPCAHGLYNYRWTPQTDPAGVVHATYDYPGVPIDRASINERHGILPGIHIPVRPHFGVVALAPSHSALLDSVPPSYFGGNIDNWRLGAGASVFLPVAVPGGLLSIGDPHASQGDAELCGTAIECSLTGTFQLVLHRRRDLPSHLGDLTYPLIETPKEWVIQGFSHPNHLAEFGEKAQSEVYKKSTLDLAMQDAFRKARRFLMVRQRLSEDEAISLLSVAVDFGVTQVVDGNWGMHAIVRKRLFEG
jgi:acetamidase/formamidase/AraC-like DNA-binding protein